MSQEQQCDKSYAERLLTDEVIGTHLCRLRQCSDPLDRELYRVMQALADHHKTTRSHALPNAPKPFEFPSLPVIGVLNVDNSADPRHKEWKTAPSTTRRSDCPLENCEKTGQCEFPQDCDAPSPATPRSGETPIADAAGLWLMAEGPLPADWKCPPGQEADIRRFDHELLGPCTEWKVVTAAVARRLERKLAEAMNRCDEALEAAEAAVRQRDTALSATPRIPDVLFDGHVVFLEANRAAGPEHTLKSHHVSAVLDAVVRLLRAADGTAKP